MTRRPPASVFMIVISVIATAGLVLAVVGAAHRNWAVVLEGLIAAALLYGLTIRTAVRQRR